MPFLQSHAFNTENFAYPLELPNTQAQMILVPGFLFRSTKYHYSFSSESYYTAVVSDHSNDRGSQQFLHGSSEAFYKTQVEGHGSRSLQVSLLRKAFDHVMCEHSSLYRQGQDWFCSDLVCSALKCSGKRAPVEN